MMSSSTLPPLCPLSLPPPPPQPSTPFPPQQPQPTISQPQWVQLLRSQARNSSFPEALHTYLSMTSAGVLPDHFAFPAALKAATGLRDLHVGEQLHAAVVKFGYHTSPVTVANTLVTLYARCGKIDYALKVFYGIPDRDQVSWNSVVAALCMFEEWELALEAFREMQEEGIEPSSFTLVSVVLACSNLGWINGLRLGKQAHGYGLRAGFYTEGKTFTNNSLIAMYAKLGMVGDSMVLFDRLDNCDLVSWNTMIKAFVQNGMFQEALAFFQELVVCARIKPDGVTLASVLPACSHLELFDAGREIHAYALRNDGLFENSFVGSALVDMYCNCGKVECGHRVFSRIKEQRLGLWNAMLAGYARNGLANEALRLFIEMEKVAGLYPNATTIASVLPACVQSKAFSRKADMHAYVVKRGFVNDPYVQNALMDMYARMGMLEISLNIFKSMEVRDIVSWNTIMTGYAICGLFREAFNLLIEMQGGRDANSQELHSHWASYNTPNSITLITVLPMCALLAALAKGKEIHAYAIRNGLEFDVAVGSALVDMYAKSGCLGYSRRVFNQMLKRNAVTWNVLIMAYGMHGHGNEALKLFDDMVAESRRGGGAKPNNITFIAVFAACSHSGMVDRGMEIFHSLRADYGIKPSADHYACVTDLLGRAGKLEEAYQLIVTMEPGQNQAGAWSSLLGACRLHQNVKLGEIAASHLFRLEPNVASHYVLLSNIYSSAGLWQEAIEVRKNMKELGVRKEPGCSWIEVGGVVHQFLVGDSLHPQSTQLHSYIKKLWERMRKKGFVPDTSCVLHNVEDDEKEVLLCGHSEKLAIAFGILNTPPGSTIRVAKNLRICNDCHTAAKYIGIIVGREIIVRDMRRFHHFKDGSCSCGDYW